LKDIFRIKRHFFVLMGLFCLNVVRSFSQGIPPEINQLIQQASAETDFTRKKQLLSDADTKANDLLSVNIKNAWLWFGKGLISQMLNQYDVARDYHKQAIEYDSDIPEFHLHFGVSHYKLDNLNEALASFQQAVQKGIAKKDKSVQADAWYWQGEIHKVRGDTADARLACSLALKLKPDHFEAKNYWTRSIGLPGMKKEKRRLQKRIGQTQKPTLKKFLQITGMYEIS